MLGHAWKVLVVVAALTGCASLRTPAATSGVTSVRAAEATLTLRNDALRTAAPEIPAGADKRKNEKDESYGYDFDNDAQAASDVTPSNTPPNRKRHDYYLGSGCEHWTRCDIEEALDQAAVAFQPCWGLAQARADGVVGALELGVLVSGTGMVEDVKVVRSGTASPKLDACVAKAMREVNFAFRGSAAGDEKTNVALPLRVVQVNR